jgi:uncharacterized protein
MTSRISYTDTHWPTAVAIAPDRVIAGAPQAATVVTATTQTGESGLWRVSEGEFTTAHAGYVEFIHIIEGNGDLVHDDGEIIPLSPGTTVTMDDGWQGRWVIREPLVKAYAILRTES